MQTYFNSHPSAVALFFPLFFLALWCTILFLISQASGWAALARRFRLTSPFTGQTWDWKRARMRWGCNYNNCLTVGSDPMGLYLSMMFPFRFGHAPLFLPWQEVSVRRHRSILFFKYVELSLGREEQIPLLIRENLADQIRLAAGSSWPMEAFPRLQ
jgi:hypothetical protein